MPADSLRSPGQLSRDGQSANDLGDSLYGTLKAGCFGERGQWGQDSQEKCVRGWASTPIVFSYVQASQLLTHPSSLALVGKPVQPLSHEDALLYVKFGGTGSLEEAAVGVCSHGLVSSPGETAAYQSLMRNSYQTVFHKPRRHGRMLLPAHRGYCGL